MRCFASLFKSFILMLSLMLYGCSSDQEGKEQEDQLEEGVEEDDAYQLEAGEESQGLEEINDLSDPSSLEGDSAEAYDGGNSLSNINDLGDGVEGLEDNSLNNAQILSDEALGNDLQGAYDAANLAADTAAPPPSGDNSQRVVRYVTADGTTVYDRPDSSATSLSTLFQGDPLVVSIQGEWAEITSGRYVMTSSLSEQMIPRVRGVAPWTAPSGPQP